MGFLDRFRNGVLQSSAAEQQPQQQQKNEISQDISTTQTSQNPSAREAVTRLPQDIRSEAQQLGGRINRAAENIQADAPAITQAPADATTNQQPMRQAMLGQDKPAPDNSPTSAQRGVRAEEVEGPSAPAQTPPQPQRQTIARPAPSWER